MTYRVVVIDDKTIIRTALVKTIDWRKLQCEVVGEAEDGMEGKRMIEELHPDILITDIKLPGPNGLDLAEHMQSILPSSKTILITGYQEFEYAKRAVKLGVFDFMLKPIRNEELSRIVQKAVDELQRLQIRKQEAQRLAQEFRKLKHQIHDSIPSLRSKLLSDLLIGTWSEEGLLSERMSVLGLQPARIVLVTIRPRHSDRRMRPDERNQLLFRLQNRVTRHAHQMKMKHHIDLIETHAREDLILALLFPKVLPDREIKCKVQWFCSELYDLVDELVQFNCLTAVSTPYKCLEETAAAFEEVCAILDAGFFAGNAKVLFPESLRSVKVKPSFAIIQDLEQLYQLLEQASYDQLLPQIDKCLEQIRTYSEGNILVAKGLISEVCLAAARYFFRATGNEFALNKSIDHILEDIYRLPDMDHASKYLHEFMKHHLAKLEGRNKNYSLQVRRILDYINKHFSGNLTLSHVAEHFGLSPSYVSRLLRAETGENFVDLVAKARIEAAKRLLKDPKMKVNEVGEMVGYKEYAYFYQVFKKFEGTSPKAYKNRM